MHLGWFSCIPVYLQGELQQSAMALEMELHMIVGEIVYMLHGEVRDYAWEGM